MKPNETHTTTHSLLDEWTSNPWTDGVQIDQLSELESLLVHTRNSTYQIVVRTPSTGEILVRGGVRFPVFTPARLCGSTAGSSLLKCIGIYPGLRMEIELEGRRIITSPVVSVAVESTASEQ
jgi:hypothetical protein